MPRSTTMSPGLKRKKWDPEQMKKAVEAVRNKSMGYKKAVKHFSVPRTTLRRLVKDAEESTDLVVRKPLGRRPILPPILEKKLVEYLLVMEAKYYGLTRMEVRRLAYQLAVRNDIPNHFRNEVAGRAWLDHFLNRHKHDLSLRKPMGTSYARSQGFNRKTVKAFFDILGGEFEKTRYPPDRIYNVDETGLTIVQSKIPYVIGRKGKRQIGALTAAERGSLMTLVCCMSVAGNYIPPMIVFPRKNFTDTLMKGAPPGAVGKAHPSGWIQSNLFTDWLRHFIAKANPTAESPVLLILDGHYSHTRNLDLLLLARENHITIVTLPPHTTHKLQPLDRTFMGALKSHYSEEIRKFMIHSDRMIKPYDIAELFGRAYMKSATAEVAYNGFKVTGIYPFNPHIFNDVDFLAEEQTTQTNAANQSTTALTNDHRFTIGVPVTKTTTRQSETPTPCSSTSADFILPEDVLPIPGPKRKTSNRGRKSTSAAVITLSPYKNMLEESLARSENRGGGQGRRGRGLGRGGGHANQASRGHIRRIETTPSDSSDSDEAGEEPPAVQSHSDSDDDVPLAKSVPENTDTGCLFCDGQYSNDRQGEEWIQCQSCEMWAHMDCAGPEGEYYICDYCR